MFRVPIKLWTSKVPSIVSGIRAAIAAVTIGCVAAFIDVPRTAPVISVAGIRVVNEAWLVIGIISVPSLVATEYDARLRTRTSVPGGATSVTATAVLAAPRISLYCDRCEAEKSESDEHQDAAEFSENLQKQKCARYVEHTGERGCPNPGLLKYRYGVEREQMDCGGRSSGTRVPESTTRRARANAGLCRARTLATRPANGH
jgi:hypothetical protein